LHAGEIRRFAEGVNYRNEQRQQKRGQTSSNVASQKQELEAGQQAERNRLLDEINDDFDGGE
jgi:hypothetical protein